MNKIYKKDEVIFAVIMIVVYVLGSNIAEIISSKIGIAKLATAIFHFVFAAFILIWIIKNGYAKKYGLMSIKYNIFKSWCFVPLIFVCFFGIAFGIKLQYNALETTLYVISMICVGFLEEIIFRGFLFVGMAKTNVTSAIIVSSLTFGIGHIVNLFTGQHIFETLVQIVFAVAIGFTLVILFYKGKSLLPCIIFHALNNSLSAFEKSNEEIASILSITTEQFEMISAGICIVLLVLYSIFMIKKLEVKEIY